MFFFFKSLIRQILFSFGYEINPLNTNQKLSELSQSFFPLWRKLPKESQELLSPFLPYFKAQYGQDLFVFFLSQTCSIKPFFVEFGASDGITWSNTYCLEKYLHWSGILAEPCISFHQALRQNRHVNLCLDCVYSHTGSELQFVHVQQSSDRFPVSSPELSTLKNIKTQRDWASAARKANSEIVIVNSISLNDLIAKYTSGFHIGYLSIDTEGSELEILRNFSFDLYTVDILTVEHNYRKDLMKGLQDLMTKNRFVKVFPNVSGPEFWYIRNSLLTELSQTIDLSLFD
jgi:FkbM family methyltransferase